MEIVRLGPYRPERYAGGRSCRESRRCRSEGVSSRVVPPRGQGDHCEVRRAWRPVIRRCGRRLADRGWGMAETVDLAPRKYGIRRCAGRRIGLRRGVLDPTSADVLSWPLIGAE